MNMLTGAITGAVIVALVMLFMGLALVGATGCTQHLMGDSTSSCGEWLVYGFRGGLMLVPAALLVGALCGVLISCCPSEAK